MGWLDFLRPETPEQIVRKWRLNLRKQERELERQIRDIEMEEKKVKIIIKQAAKRGERQVCMTLAKEIIRSKRTKEHIFTNKTQLNSLSLQLQQLQARNKMMDSIKKSTELMRVMNSLLRVPQLHQSIRTMQQEMIKAHVIEDIMEDTLETMDDIEMETEAEKETDLILSELAKELFIDLDIIKSELPEKEKQPAIPTKEEKLSSQPNSSDKGLESIHNRITILKST
jgi:charged multivesicular body protein 3